VSVLFDYFWPPFAAAIVIGAVALTIVFRRRLVGWKRNILLEGAALLSVIAALIWSGPLGGARSLTDSVDVVVERTLAYYEMPQIRAKLDSAPLTRQLVLEGPADDFQRQELARILTNVPGVSDAVWTGSQHAIPLIAEVAIDALLGFLCGLLLAYLLELHRRHNAQWDW
jgi:hypothetical protein